MAKAPKSDSTGKIEDGLLDAALAQVFGEETGLPDAPQQFSPCAETPTKNLPPPEPKPFEIAVEGYEILRELGRGGMGVVYLARHAQLKRLVALKMILSGAHASAQVKQRFQTEAEAVARLQHPNIVQLYEISERDGCPFFSLEYVAGGSLANRLDGTPWPAKAAAELTETLAIAIHEAHQRGIIHRDLKPANILMAGVRNQGSGVSHRARQDSLPNTEHPTPNTPKITDFGLAKLLDEEHNRTESGAILGTPSYMAPELARAGQKRVCPAADIYSLGTVLYELLTGRPPFKADSAVNTLLQVVSSEPVQPSRFQPKLPVDLETICLKCLEKEPGKRYASAQALPADLRRFLDGKPIVARPIGPLQRLGRWCKRQPKVAALLAGIAALMLAIFVLAVVYAFDKEAAAAVAQKLAGEKQQEADRANKEKDTADKNAAAARRMTEKLYAEKGMRLAENGDVLEGLHWLVKPLRQHHGRVEMELQHRRRIGAYLRYSRIPELREMLIHPHEVQRAFFSPDGKHVITVQNYSFVPQIWDATTGKRIGSIPKDHGLIGPYAISPDGRLALIQPVERKVKSVLLWDMVQGSPVGSPLEYASVVRKAALSPDKKFIAVALSNGEIHIWNAATRKHVATELKNPPPLFTPQIVFSPDGKKILTIFGPVAHLWQTNIGQVLREFPVKANTLIRPVFSPDGSHCLLTAVNMGSQQFAQVWSNSRGKATGSPLEHDVLIKAAAFSPDGNRVATAGFDFTAQVWDAKTGERIGAALRHDSRVLAVEFSPDNRFVVTGSDNKKARVWDAVTGLPVTPWLQHHNTVYSVAFRSGGKQFLTASADGTVRLWNMPGEAGSTVQSHPLLKDDRAFSPDGKNLLIAGWAGISVWNRPSGRLLFPPLDGEPILAACFTSDGSRFVIAKKSATEVRDTTTGKLAGNPVIHGPLARSAWLSPGGRSVAVCYGDHTIRIFDMVNAKLFGKPLKYGQPTHFRAFSGDGQAVSLISDMNKTAHVRKVQTGQLAGSPIKAKSQFSGGLLNFDGSRVVLIDRNCQVRIYDVSSGQAVTQPMTHNDKVCCIKFSPDEKLLVTASDDLTVRVWDASTGKPKSAPMPIAAQLGRASFSPDGKRVVTSSFANSAQVWDVASGQPLTPPLDHTDRALRAQFTPDGKQVLSVSEKNKIWLWDVSPDTRPVSVLVRLTELLHGYRLHRNGAFVPLAPSEQQNALHVLRRKYGGP